MHSPTAAAARDPRERLAFVPSIPFFLLHLMPLGILWTGVSLGNLALCLGLYVVRMFFITAGYHRYFAHRSYKLGRFAQFVMAFGGGTAVQKGALWWAAHHRDHHRHSDTELDVHSPKDGFWWSHVGWILCRKYNETRYEGIRDFARYPELVWLNKHHWVPGALLGTACYVLGGPGALFAGFFLSTVLLYHGTFTINSLAHVWGKRRYETSDTSRNSLVLALITLGEGWHNNHHHFQACANQGFFWWEVDVSYYIIKLLSLLGVARDVRVAPEHVVLGRPRKRSAARVPVNEPAAYRAASCSAGSPAALSPAAVASAAVSSAAVSSAALPALELPARALPAVETS